MKLKLNSDMVILLLPVIPLVALIIAVVLEVN